VGGTCTVNVQFVAPTSGSFTATLSFDDDAEGSPHTVTLTGRGVIPRPDLLIGKTRKLTKFIGNNIYNSDGTGQSITLKVRRKKTKKFYILVQNDGNAPDAIRVEGTGGDPGTATTRYFLGDLGTFDITVATETHAFTTSTLAAGASTGAATLIRLEVTAEPLAVKRTTVTVPITGISVADPSKTDTVNAIVIIR
jgi:hypothetical protein